MECRPNCAICCIAPSINQPLPGMPHGKPAGQYCFNLDPVSLICRIWDTEQYPQPCRGFKPAMDTCGSSREEASDIIRWLEEETKPQF